MKKVFLTLFLTASFGLVSVQANNASVAQYKTVCDGEHKCDDKCKKDKDGKCKEASTDKEKTTETVSSCCKKGQDSCKDSKSNKEKGKKQKAKS